MSTSELASLTTAGDITRLTLRRAPLNFLNLEMLQKIQELLESLGDAPLSRVLVLDSACPAFCAGLEMAQQNENAAFLLLDQYHSVARALSSFPRPTVAIVKGVALGAGNELAACCDFVLASAQAAFGQPEIKVGTIPSLAPLLLPQRIGLQRTMQMILTGNLVDAREAERIGLTFRVVAEDELDAALAELMASFRESSIAVMELALRAARSTRNHELDHNLRESQSLFLNELMDLDDTVEGVRSFLQKRTPKWKNR